MIGTLGKWLGLIALAAAGGMTGCWRSPQARKAHLLEDGKERLKRKDYARALLQFRTAVQVAPDDAEAHYQLGLALIETGDVPLGMAHLRKATELNPKLYAAQIVLAQLMLTSSDLKLLLEAQKRLQTVTRAQPDNAVALTTLGFVEWKLGQAGSAEKLFQEALARNPAYLDASVALAKMLVSRQDRAGAEAVLKQAVARNPKAAAPLISLAEFNIDAQRWPEAEQHFLRALAVDPSSGQALNELAALQLKMGRIDDADKSYRRLAQFPDKQYQAYHAKFLIQLGRQDAALEELQKIYTRDPSNREVRGLLVNLCMKTGQHALAERALNAALKANSNDAEALTDRANLYVIQGKLVEAQQAMMQVLRLHPDAAPAHQNLASIDRLRGYPESERRELYEALRLEPNLLLARLDLARNLIRGGAPKEALQVLEEAQGCKTEAGCPLAVIELRNWAYLALHDLDSAARGIEAGLRMGRTRDLMLASAQLRLDRHDAAGARSLLHELLRGTPEDDQILQLLQATYARPCDAAKEFRGLVSARTPSAILQYRLGQSLAACGLTEEARGAFQAAYAANANLVAAVLELARLDAQQGKLDEARQRLKPWAGKSTDAMVALSMIERQDGDLHAAIADLRKAADAQPQNALILNNLAYLLADRGSADEALMLAQKAKDLAPHSANVDDTLGWAYFNKRIYKSALHCFEMAVDEEPSPRHKIHLAMACARVGEVQRGRQVLEAALKAAPDLPEAQTARQLLAQAAVQR